VTIQEICQNIQLMQYFHVLQFLTRIRAPILICCCQFSNIEAKLWFHFLSSRFLSHFCKYTS
jgi:hypothetical protein